MPTSSGVIWTASPMARMLASRFACVRMTPLGSPVEPEVYCRSAMSLPWRARLPVTCSGSAPGDGGGALSAAAINFSASTTPSSERTRGRSNLATDSARRNVSSMQTSALFMIADRSEEHTSELQSRLHLVCRLLLEKKKKRTQQKTTHHHVARRRTKSQTDLAG